jgi:hypothetical protein
MSTWKENPPKVELLIGPSDPLSVIYEVWQRARDGTDRDFPWLPKTHIHCPRSEDDSPRREAEVRLFRKLIFDYTQIPEILEFGWWLGGVPRAFFDQAVRHRKTSMFARSQRVIPETDFADRENYLTTSPISSDPYAREVYRKGMGVVQEAYKTLLEMGVPVEDARGILPLHLRTGFMWGTSLRDMAEVFRTRTCHVLQQEYWGPIIQQMSAMCVKIDPELDIIFQPPCLRPENQCVSKTEAMIRVTETVAGLRTDLKPCRLWIEKYETPELAAVVLDRVAEGKTKWAQAPEDFA